MINENKFQVGISIASACEKMYHDVLINEIPESTNFNGVRIIMFYDGGKAECRKGKLDQIEELCNNCTDDDNSTIEQILKIID